MSGICSGRVVIVTGAGGGLGAAHARTLAAEGAAVLVNDINLEAADAVVAEIISAGGQAVTNASDITHYESSGEAIEQALATFGDFHAVVNNAGNNRDRMFASMSEADWDAVMAVHLKGHFCLAVMRFSTGAIKLRRATVSAAVWLTPPQVPACKAQLDSQTTPLQKQALRR